MEKIVELLEQNGFEFDESYKINNQYGKVFALHNDENYIIVDVNNSQANEFVSEQLAEKFFMELEEKYFSEFMVEYRMAFNNCQDHDQLDQQFIYDVGEDWCDKAWDSML